MKLPKVYIQMPSTVVGTDELYFNLADKRIYKNDTVSKLHLNPDKEVKVLKVKPIRKATDLKKGVYLFNKNYPERTYYIRMKHRGKNLWHVHYTAPDMQGGNCSGDFDLQWFKKDFKIIQD